MHVAVLPEASVTVQITLVVPTGNVAGALLVTDATEQLSFVVGVPRATEAASQVPLSAFARADSTFAWQGLTHGGMTDRSSPLSSRSGLLLHYTVHREGRFHALSISAVIPRLRGSASGGGISSRSGLLVHYTVHR